jgi:hypothetical protein
LLIIWGLLVWFFYRFYKLHYRLSDIKQKIVKIDDPAYKTDKDYGQDIEELNPDSPKYVGSCVYNYEEQKKYYEAEKERRAKRDNA